MDISVRKALAKLESLEPDSLFQTTKKSRVDLASAEWRMAVCLLACERNKKVFLAREYANIREFGQKELGLSSKKVWELLSVAKILEHLPTLSKAFRAGQLGWAKLRAIKGVVTPDTEREWLEFALRHDANQIESALKFTPKEWKRFQAMKASLASTPICTGEEVRAMLLEAVELAEEEAATKKRAVAETRPVEQGELESSISTEMVSASSDLLDRQASSDAGNRACHSREQDVRHESQTTVPAFETEDKVRMSDEARAQSGATRASNRSGDYSQAGKTTGSTEPAPEEVEVNIEAALKGRAGSRSPSLKKQKVSFKVEMTPDEYSLYETALKRIQARHQRWVRRGKAIALMAEALLNEGTSASRAKHQILIHTLPDLGLAWYDTDKGILPVSSDALKKALEEKREPIRPNQLQGGAESQKTYSPTSGRRTGVPAPIVRQLYARAGARCERCRDKRGPFHIHHMDPISEGGTHDIESLQLLCGSCHSLKHMEDFQTKSGWRNALEAKRKRV